MNAALGLCDMGDNDESKNSVVTEYLLLGLRFDRIESGYVDSFTGDPALRQRVENEPTPNPADLARQATTLRAELAASDLDGARKAFIDTHLKALACAGRKFAGEDIGFVDEVHDYFDVRIAKGDEERYRQAHEALENVLPEGGSLLERKTAYDRSQEIDPSRLRECVDAFSSALRDRVRADFPLPDTETVKYEVVSDKPWSGFNYYEGNYRSTVAVNSDLKQYLNNVPALIAHESYPGHHTEHCRKEAGLVRIGEQAEQTIFLVNTPQCLMAEGPRRPGALCRRGRGLGLVGAGDLCRPGAAFRRRTGSGHRAGSGRPDQRPPGCRPDAA
ncbi:CalR9 protein [Mycobacteroides abscessus]|nr:CalR9 protein [Mycobacteroides abscessus]